MNTEFMKYALKMAHKAYKKDEVPIGAVIVKDGKILAKAYNTRNKSQIATNHAEVLAIKKACKKLKSWRLEGCDIYVTLEPCPMCAGAILNARINNLHYGAIDKTSDGKLLEQILNDKRLNHKTKATCGVLQEECSQILTSFFEKKRGKKTS